MKDARENAVVYCRNAFQTTNGKTAHGLVRFTGRYRVTGVVDPRWAGRDAGEVLDGAPNGIPIHAGLDEAVAAARGAGLPPVRMVIGLTPDGGRLDSADREGVLQAIALGLHVDSGLHTYLSDDPEMREAASRHGVELRDIRRPPDRNSLHFFTGKIEEVDSFRIAVLGTDSAVGKRTTAWKLVEAFEAAGRSTEMIGTGQTAWLQGARYSIMLDSLINDFLTGEIEHAVWSAWKERRPEILVIEGQGGMLNPAYPGGYEILAAARPHLIVLQHAPARLEYDGFPGYPIQPLARQIEAVEIVGGRPVAAIAVNHENMDPESVPAMCEAIARVTGLPAFDVLLQGAGGMAAALLGRLDHPGARGEGRGK
ncbi:MAG: DUF1611 domain-containing protein [Candidatus Eisenbacteria bacterium]|nr:DUF1611 domain-containing protein [Candidatus Eisenbacteria bacterium]